MQDWRNYNLVNGLWLTCHFTILSECCCQCLLWCYGCGIVPISFPTTHPSFSRLTFFPVENFQVPFTTCPHSAAHPLMFSILLFLFVARLDRPHTQHDFHLLLLCGLTCYFPGRKSCMVIMKRCNKIRLNVSAMIKKIHNPFLGEYLQS